MQLANRTVVMLGGSSGIGLATAQAALSGGANVIITGRSSERLKAARALPWGNARTVALDTVEEDGTGVLSMNSFTWITSSSRR
jgi:NAD(P)-dependent dehydrogenase (short-subunit alcohol dehydrogenase family)